MGRYDDSIAQYEESLKRGLDNSMVGIGWNYVFKGDYDKAREYYQKYSDTSSRNDEKLQMLRLIAASYATEDKIDASVKTFVDYRSLAKKENMNTDMILSYAYQGLVLIELGDPAAGLQKYEKAVELANTLDLPAEEKENYKFNSCNWLCYALASNNKFTEAELELKKAKAMVELRKDAAEERAFQAMVAFFAYKKGNYAKAVEHFSKSNQVNPRNLYYMAMINIHFSEKEKAKTHLEKLKNWNLNNFYYFVVRNRAIEELTQF